MLRTRYDLPLKKTKKARVGQIILSGIVLVSGGRRSEVYRNSRRMAVNGLVQQLCMEEKGGFVDLWDFVAKEDMSKNYERWTAP